MKTVPLSTVHQLRHRLSCLACMLVCGELVSTLNCCGMGVLSYPTGLLVLVVFIARLYGFGVDPVTPKSDHSNFPCSLTRNITHMKDDPMNNSHFITCTFSL